MSGGGDSGGIGAGRARKAAFRSSDGMAFRRAKGTAGGGATLSVTGAGAQVAQQIVLLEHGSCEPSQPRWPARSPS